MSVETIREIIQTRYQIKLSKNRATFTWSSNRLTSLKSSVDLKTRIDPRELTILAKSFGALVERDKIIIQDLEQYNRLLIYACVRTSLRRAENISKLQAQIFGMTTWDAHYWAAAFREQWWKKGKSSGLRRLVKAFKLFFEID